MKKTNLVLGFMLVMLLFATGLFAGTYSGGNGSTAETAYQIANLNDLQELQNTTDDWGSYFEQTADINASSVSWSPIGNPSIYFTGTYDGQEHTIDGLQCLHPFEYYKGFFGITGTGAEILNLGLTNVEMNGDDYIGALVGYSAYSGTISNCYSSGLVRGQGYVGGLIGYNVGTSITDCYSSATVSISSIGYSKFGGLVGSANSCTISNCYSTGSVNGQASIGGLVGRTTNSVTIIDCYSTGNVNCTNNSGGGLVGSHNESSTISNCYSTGYVGGAGAEGGLVGRNYSSTVSNSFYDSETSGQSDNTGKGVPKTTAEMTTDALIYNYTTNIYLDAGWDFKGESTNGTVDIWNIGNSRNSGYPYLDWQYPEDPATLPITLSSFTVQYLNESPVLCWTTQSETSNLGWNIYRSQTDILEEAMQINSEIIPGAGTTSEPTDYIYEDESELMENTEYWYWLESIDYSGLTDSYGPISLIIPEQGEEPGSPEIPDIYGLHQNYPNPFNPNTEISFMMKENCIAELTVYNIKGEEIANLFQNKSVSKDELIRANWAGKDNFGKAVSSGIYLYKLRTNKEEYTCKMILMK